MIRQRILERNHSLMSDMDHISKWFLTHGYTREEALRAAVIGSLRATRCFNASEAIEAADQILGPNRRTNDGE